MVSHPNILSSAVQSSKPGFAHICQLEQIPEYFKRGIIIPAFKGKGRDPLLKKNYRGVTLTSVLAKALEIAIMQRLEPILDDAGIPQTTQTAYRKGVSCQDSIFAGMETNTRFLLEKEKVYTCFYDLASTFDTVEFSVLLEELFRAGIRGKCWRLVRHWYSNLVSQVPTYQGPSTSHEASVRGRFSLQLYSIWYWTHSSPHTKKEISVSVLMASI